ncbi:MAG TPA: hypothetical protein VJY35_11515, partial [Candidatus Eisenbacteria bacterium]|nr:hypothetical protein [Candidatus Eisenbacteria bacterium]
SAALGFGVGLGDLARRIGLRRAVARDNLARAFPERSEREREGILAAHYRDLGMMLCEASRGAASALAPEGEVVAAMRGIEHLEAARQAGRGAIVLTGHYGDYGVLAGWLSRLNPVDMVTQRLRNPSVDALITGVIGETSMRRLVGGRGLREVLEGLRENHWVMILGDQDAGRHGVFVSFLGRPCSTHTYPAQLALRTGAPIVMAFITRRPDRRNEIDLLPPIVAEGPETPEAVQALTERHVAVLETWVRRHPEMWFWLHRRWKTLPPAAPASDARLAREA